MIPQQPRSFTTHNGNRKWEAQANLAKLHIFDLIDFYEWIQYIDTGSFSKDVFSQGAEYKVFLGVILMFLAFSHSKLWAKFHFGTFKLYD